MDQLRNKLLLLGALGTIFVVTLFFSYSPPLSLASLASILDKELISGELSHGDMVTSMVTSEKQVTFKNVTNVTSVSLVSSPAAGNNKLLRGVVPIDQQLVTPPGPISGPDTTPAIAVVSPTSFEPPLVYSVTPQITPTQTPLTQSLAPVPSASKVNINTANLSELERITGVGPAYAQKIIDYRTANGPFLKIEDVINVKGIGDKTFQKMKDEITVGA
ncbi:MAG: helix-hairpin-helix domain-containing protein [Candidatus Pacebacteria bacterium]|nr:helix-hairpin-helix domain-containing protein [Candidatus Paceibacterota bacterium]